MNNAYYLIRCEDAGLARYYDELNGTVQRSAARRFYSKHEAYETLRKIRRGTSATNWRSANVVSIGAGR